MYMQIGKSHVNWGLVRLSKVVFQPLELLRIWGFEQISACRSQNYSEVMLVSFFASGAPYCAYRSRVVAV